MCTSFYQLIALISVQDDDAVEVLRRMNYLSQEGLQQTIYLSVLQSKPVKRFNKMIAIYNMRQVHSDFRIFKFCVLFNFLYQIIYEIKSLQNFTLCYIFNSEVFQIYGIKFYYMIVILALLHCYRDTVIRVSVDDYCSTKFIIIHPYYTHSKH